MDKLTIITPKVNKMQPTSNIHYLILSIFADGSIYHTSCNSEVDMFKSVATAINYNTTKDITNPPVKHITVQEIDTTTNVTTVIHNLDI